MWAATGDGQQSTHTHDTHTPHPEEIQQSYCCGVKFSIDVKYVKKYNINKKYKMYFKLDNTNKIHKILILISSKTCFNFIVIFD